jgi:hypothetical protein
VHVRLGRLFIQYCDVCSKLYAIESPDSYCCQLSISLNELVGVICFVLRIFPCVARFCFKCGRRKDEMPRLLITESTFCASPKQFKARETHDQGSVPFSRGLYAPLCRFFTCQHSHAFSYRSERKGREAACSEDVVSSHLPTSSAIWVSHILLCVVLFVGVLSFASPCIFARQNFHVLFTLN